MSQPAAPQTSTSAFLHSLGHSRRFRDVSYESALPTRTDILGRTGHVGKVPILLQKSQKAQRLISRQRTKQAKIADQ
jgi:hypothetical protein